LKEVKKDNDEMLEFLLNFIKILNHII